MECTSWRHASKLLNEIFDKRPRNLQFHSRNMSTVLTADGCLVVLPVVGHKAMLQSLHLSIRLSVSFH